jgi:hypothetical protein
MLLWGYRGSPDSGDFLSAADALALLSSASASAAGDLPMERIHRLLQEQLVSLPRLRPAFDQLAEQRCQHLVEKKRFGVVYPALPMDVLGIYILLPA